MKKNKQVDQYTSWVEGKKSEGTILTDALDAAFAAGPSAAASQHAQAALKRALAPDTATIYYDLLEHTPLGPVWVACGPRGLVAIEYDGSEATFRAYLAKHHKGNPMRSANQVAGVMDQVAKYLIGQIDHWDLKVDLSSITPFQRSVLEEARRVPRGQVSTYAEIAKRIGNPKAVRAVGQALRRNPVPIVVPCHRVIASDGTLGGYGGRMRDKRKIELLKLEGVVLA